MKRRELLLAGLLIGMSAGTRGLGQVAGEHIAETANHPVAAIQDTETAAQRDARMTWWREARFGMFIHWGLYSIPAGTWDGKRVPGIGEWIMNNASIPVAPYEALAPEFNPTAFSAHDIVALAKAAGMKYIVITSKHHDGFAMFDSKANAFNIAAATPFKRDPIAELAAECRKQGIKLGFITRRTRTGRLRVGRLTRRTITTGRITTGTRRRMGILRRICIRRRFHS